MSHFRYPSSDNRKIQVFNHAAHTLEGVLQSAELGHQSNHHNRTVVPSLQWLKHQCWNPRHMLPPLRQHWCRDLPRQLADEQWANQADSSTSVVTMQSTSVLFFQMR